MLTRYTPSAEQPWNLRRVVHLHRRAGFAATWKEIQRDLHDGPDAAIERLVRPPDAATGTTSFDDLSRVIADAAVESGNVQRLKAWWLYRLLFSPDPLGERLTLMWHNHFATSFVKVADVGLMRRQNDTLRAHARAPFGELLSAALHDPALLLWLDADANRKEHPNENLAREMMELFALGVGNYTETDIREAARALTGWRVVRGEFQNHEERHDPGEKSIFDHTGTWTGDDAVRLLSEHSATPQRIAARLCDTFMGETGRTTELLTAVSDKLSLNSLNIGATVESLLRSEQFFADANVGTRVLGPAELVIGAVRALELTAPPPSTLLLAETTANLGQDLFAPPNVFGWPGGRAWLTSRTLIARANFAQALVNGELHTRARPFDPLALASTHGCESAVDRTSFYAQLLLGQPHLPDSLQPYVDSPIQLVSAILASPEAQLA